MSVSLTPPMFLQFFVPGTNQPAVGSQLFTYIAGTSTKQATWTDSTQITQSANPIIADANGVMIFWLDPSLLYKFVWAAKGDTDPPSSPIYSVDNISGIITSAVLTQAFIGSILYPRTAAEIAASVTPVNFAYAPGDVRRYGATGNGSTDDSTAFANAALVCGTHPMQIPYTSTGYKIGTPFSLPANATMIGIGEGRPKLFATTNGVEICSALSVAGEITVKNILFAGTSASTTPVNNPTGLGVTATALLNITSCSDVRIYDCEFSTFYSGVCTALCTRVWIERNRVSTFLYTGILVTQTTSFCINENDISNCTQAGAAVAYGIQCTGNFPTHTSQYNSINFNRIIGIPSWDGIGSHDVDGLRVIGNDIRNVRTGVDIGHLNNTNQVQNLVVTGNYIEGTNTDTYAGAGAEMAGIVIAGFDATHRVFGATITGNLIRGFFNVTGLVGAGFGAGCICVANIDDANITGNAIANGGFGNTPQSTGIFIQGTCNRLTLGSNSIQGQSYPRGAIRLQSVIADVVTIIGNSGIQSTTANGHVVMTGSTIGLLSVNNNPSNSTVPISIATSTYSMAGPESSRVRVVIPYSASMSFEAGLGNEFEVTATNAAVFSISNPLDPVDGQRITLRIINTSGGALGAVTFGTQYKMSTWTQPATGFSRSVDLQYNGTNWYQISQTGVDIPN